MPTAITRGSGLPSPAAPLGPWPADSGLLAPSLTGGAEAWLSSPACISEDIPHAGPEAGSCPIRDWLSRCYYIVGRPANES